MPHGGRDAGGKSRRTYALIGLCVAAGCTTPTVAARAVWIGSEHGLDGSRPLFVYSAGEITEGSALPVAQGEGGSRLVVEVAPRGGGVLVRGVDDSWVGELGSEVGFRAAYVDLEDRRVVPLALPGERVPANVASFVAAGDALAWGETCPPAIALVPLRAAVSPPIDEMSGGVVPLHTGGKSARASCSATRTPALASAADAPRVFAIDAELAGGRSVVQREGTLEALRYPRAAGDPAGLESIAAGRLPAGHRPVALVSLICPGGDPNCGIAVVDPDGAAISVAVRDGDCRLLRWTVGEEEAICVIDEDAPPELDTDTLVAAISAEHYVLHSGQALHRFEWATGELTSRPLIGEAADTSVQVTADGRAVALLRARGPMLRVDADAMELVSVDQRACPGPQEPVLSPSGRHAAWTCTLAPTEPVEPDETANSQTFAEIVRIGPGGMERYQGVPMWALAIDDDGSLLLHSRGVRRQQNEVDVGEQVQGARNLYVLAADGELARVSTLEPNPEPILGLSFGTARRIVARPF